MATAVHYERFAEEENVIFGELRDVHYEGMLSGRA